MVAYALVEEQIRDGRRLLERLDQSGYPVVAAIWFRATASDSIRLILASPEVDEKGSTEVYKKVLPIISGIDPPLAFPDEAVSVVGRSDPIVTEFRIFAGTDSCPYIGDNHIFRSVIGDTFVDEAYVYRAERIVGIDHDIELLFAERPQPHYPWQSYPGKLSIRKGFLVNMSTPPGRTVKSKEGTKGLSTELFVVGEVQQRNGKPFGRLMRWSWQNGRLVGMSDVPDYVPLDHPPSVPPVRV